MSEEIPQEYNNQSPEEIDVGCWVQIRDPDIGEVETFHLVEEAAALPEKGRISANSPFAQALIGSRPGETVSYPTPMGEEEVKILDAGRD